MIDSETGVVSTADDGVFDYESAASHTITVQATSDDGSSSEQTFTVHVADVDEFNVGAVNDVDSGANSVLEHAAADSSGWNHCSRVR